MVHVRDAARLADPLALEAGDRAERLEQLEDGRLRTRRDVQIEPLRRRLSDPNFVDKAKPEAVTKAKSDLAMLDDELAKVVQRMRGHHRLVASGGPL